MKWYAPLAIGTGLAVAGYGMYYGVQVPESFVDPVCMLFSGSSERGINLVPGVVQGLGFGIAGIGGIGGLAKLLQD